MKRIFSILVVMLLVAILLPSCGKKSVETSEPDMQSSAVPGDLSGSSVPISEMRTPNVWDINSADLASVNVKDIITLGKYEQDNNTDNGTEKIEWIVLRIERGKALLISKSILDIRKYNNEAGNVCWDNSDIRKWLNKDFYKASFSQSDKDFIYPYEHDEITDNVFLLSSDESKIVFENGDTDCKTSFLTPYAEYQIPLMKTVDGWLLRDTLPYMKSSTYIASYGDPHDDSNKDITVCLLMPISQSTPYYVKPDSAYGIRPSIWISMD